MGDLNRQQEPDITPAKPVVTFVPVYVRSETTGRNTTAGKIFVVILIVMFGLGAGWLAGKVLNHQRDDRAFPPDTTAPQQAETQSSPSQLQMGSQRSNETNAAPANSPADSLEPENVPPPVRREPASKPPELRAIPAPAPPHMDREKGNEKIDYAGSQASGETQARKDSGEVKDNSQKALRKILRESGAAGNSNQNRSESSNKAIDNKGPGVKKSQNENKNEGSPK
jgi:cytoskeletal protein RodZ